MPVHKKNIPGLQIVGFSLNVVSCLAGQKDDDLVKIMIMVGEGALGLILDMKKPEFLSVEISAADAMEISEVSNGLFCMLSLLFLILFQKLSWHNHKIAFFAI